MQVTKIKNITKALRGVKKELEIRLKKKQLRFYKLAKFNYNFKNPI